MKDAQLVNAIWADCLALMEALMVKINTTFQNYDQLSIRTVIATRTTAVPSFTMIIVASNDGDMGVDGNTHVNATVEYDTTSIRFPAMHVHWTDTPGVPMVAKWNHRTLVTDFAQLHLFLSTLEDEFGGPSFTAPISQIPK